MKQKLFSYRQGRLSAIELEAPGALRWVLTRRGHDGGSSTLAGDLGSLIELEHDSGRSRIVSTGTEQNLRCVDWRPGDASLSYACGNAGSLLRVRGEQVDRLHVDSRAALRRIAWNHEGSRALVVGNGGVALALSSSEVVTRVFGADTNLRSIAWRPGRDSALVTGNCFRDSIGGLTPSHNLFKLEGDTLTEVSDLEASRADLTASAWHPDGVRCLVAGFDQTWHTATLLSYTDDGLTDLQWGAEGVFPTSCAWHPSGSYALIGTTRLTAGEGTGSLYRFEEGSARVTKLQDTEGYGISCISWRDEETALLACSRRIRAYSA